MGSCFAEGDGRTAVAHKFTTRVNPFGVIFNPVSLAALLDQALAGGSADREGLVQTREGWRHYDFHSRLGAPDPGALLAQTDAALAATGRFLADAGWLLLTLGTAFAYRRKDNGAVVANCHKVPNCCVCQRTAAPGNDCIALGRRLEPAGRAAPAPAAFCLR
jgi:hypothetical protein